MVWLLTVDTISCPPSIHPILYILINIVLWFEWYYRPVTPESNH